MVRRAGILIATLLCASAGFAQLFTPPLNTAERRHVIEEARYAHYSFFAAGLVSFQCAVDPDWNAFIRQLNIRADDPLVPVLKSVKFSVMLSDDGTVTVKHSAVQAPDAALGARAEKTAAGLDQMIRGFLNTWTSFAGATPLPEIDSDYQIEMARRKYHLTYHDGDALVHTTIGDDFAIEEVDYSSEAMSVIVLPTWTRSVDGFLLTGYDGITEIKPQGLARIQITIESSPVDGLPLPSVVTETSPTPGGTIEVPFTFTNYTVTKNAPPKQP